MKGGGGGAVNRWCDLISLFGRRESDLSLIFNKVSKASQCTFCIHQKGYL